MNERYYIDLQKYDLQKFKQSLKRRDLIPSRVILKENLDKRFEVMSKQGIKTLKDLIDVLKNKQKIEIFSKKSELPVDYLTILKREASSYLPNPVKLDKFTWIDKNAIDILDSIGIKNTRNFFEKINNSSVEKVSLETGISSDKLQEIYSLSDLARLYGVGPVFAKIIYDVGIVSAEKFVTISGKEFIEIYEKKLNKKADFSVSDIDFSIELARELRLPAPHAAMNP